MSHTPINDLRAARSLSPLPLISRHPHKAAHTFPSQHCFTQSGSLALLITDAQNVKYTVHMYKDGVNSSGVFWSADFVDESINNSTKMCTLFTPNVPGFQGFGDMQVGVRKICMLSPTLYSLSASCSPNVHTLWYLLSTTSSYLNLVPADLTADAMRTLTVVVLPAY